MSIPSVLKEALTFDEGSLPGFYFEELSASEVDGIYTYIRMNSARPSDEVTVWSNVENRDIPLNLIDRPAQKVISREITPICHPIIEFNEGEAITTCASVYVFPDSVEIFYDPREMQCENEAGKLLALVKQITRIAKVRPPYLGDEVGNPREPRCQHALQSYVES
jgi:hypothetical protein